MVLELFTTTRMFGQALGATGLAGLLALSASPMTPALVAAALAALALLCSAARIALRPRRQAEPSALMG